MYKYGSFFITDGKIAIEIEGCIFDLKDMSEETQEYIKFSIENGADSGCIIEVNEPLDEEETGEMKLRCTELQSIMENNLFEKDDELILSCEWKQLISILNK